MGLSTVNRSLLLGRELKSGVTERLPQQVKSTEYCHLILFHVDTNGTVKHNPGKFSEDFRAPVAQVKRMGPKWSHVASQRQRCGQK